MKQFIKNLLMPFAVVAMLSLGAFTMNASNKADNKIEISEETATPYGGDLYYLDGAVFKKATQIVKRDCSFEGFGPLYEEDINSETHQIYGWDSSVAEYKPLRLIM
ncbi:hypothetical protein [Myroides marinus]|nr:hypothetical protein [Myroides marinus]